MDDKYYTGSAESKFNRINYYKKNPLHVYILNSKTQEYDKCFVIINSPPANVMRAIKASGENLRNKSILNDYFGPTWKKILIPNFKRITNELNESVSSNIGGTKPSHNEKDLFAAFTESPSISTDQNSISPDNIDHQPIDKQIIYIDYSIYPEDSIETLKNKLYIITGISPYRQHINVNKINPYKFILQNNLIIPKFENVTNVDAKNKLYDIPINRNIELYRDTIKIISFEHETLESFTSDSAERLRMPVHVVELIDFDTTFSDVIAKPGIIDDQYQFDLLYYGASIAFWPQLSREAFKIAITGGQEAMTQQFPLLNPSLDILIKRLNIEKQLIDKTYEFAINPPKVYRATTRPFSAISYTYVSNVESMPAGINLRNIFDLFKLDKFICVSRLYFKPNSGSGFKNVIKKHILAPDDVIKRIYEKSLKFPSVLIGTDTTTLTIQEDQIYYEQIWKEDIRIDYKDAIFEAEKQANKIINIINNMGVSAFPIGNKIPIGKYDKIIRSNIAAFWPRVLTTNGFFEFKRLVQFYNGSIYEIKSSGAGSIILTFKKGMTDFDIPRLLRFYNRLKEDEIIEFINTYSYLTNPIALKRWQTYYSGKTVRIYHKTSEIKIESLDVTIEEFEIVKRYFFTMLDLFISKSRQGIIKLQTNKSEPQYEKFLQRLREHDPELYDLKRHDKNANVYSIICQSGKQPYIYDEYDLKNVPQSKIRNLIKYWNFTENKPAYYECPYKEYPHLGFRSNEHPLGYCLPCCQKLTAIPGTKQDLINNLCLKDHKITEKSEELIESLEGTTEEIARHSVQYGKIINHGRIGECHAIINNGLFYNAVQKPYAISLIGVRQYVPATHDAGFFFSLCYILNIFADNLVSEFIEVIKHLSNSFYTLGQSEANKFETADQLIQALYDTLITGEQFTAFTQDVNFIPIIIDLIYIRFGISVILMVDTKSINQTAAQDFILHTTPTTNSQIITDNGELFGSPNHKSIEIAIIFKTPTGYYPFSIINKRMYSKYPELTRRTFKLTYESREGITPVPDTVAETIINVIKSNEEKTMSLAVIKEFVRSNTKSGGGNKVAGDKKSNINSKYKITHKLIGVNDLCYGVVLLNNSSKISTYLPVYNSPHHVDGIPAIYGVRNPTTITRIELMTIIYDFNKYLKANNYTEIIPVSNITNANGKIIGFVSEGLYYYHLPELLDKQIVRGQNSNLVNINHPYDTIDIDKSIFKYHGKPQPLDTIIDNIANMELYENYLYKLLLFEFASILQEERNEPLRKELIQIIKKTNFYSSISLSKMSELITKQLEKYPNDQKIIKLAITNREDESIGFINNNVFEFDSLIIQQLRELASSKSVEANDIIIKKLDDILKNRVNIVNIKRTTTDQHKDNKTYAPVIDNLITSCNVNISNGNYCTGSKLNIDKEKYDTFLKIMAQDVTNQLKNFGMFLVASGVRNPMKFITRPDERLYIT